VHLPSAGLARARGFAPTPEEIDWARRVIATAAGSDGAAIRSDEGQMIDRPVLVRAQAILTLADQ
jgi:citrate lyase subunit beta / citryl-CoA lyase